MPEEDGEVRPSFPISDGAIDLFEALPEAFTLCEALDEAERLGTVSNRAACHLRAYLQQDMVVQVGSCFTKTARADPSCSSMGYGRPARALSQSVRPDACRGRAWAARHIHRTGLLLPADIGKISDGRTTSRSFALHLRAAM